MAPAAKSVLLTGTSSGIGRAAAERLAADGWRVFAAVRDETAATELEAISGEVTPLRLDVTDEAQIAAVAEQVAGHTGGRLDALVDNAGIGVGGAMETVPMAELREIFEVNVIGQIALIRACLPMLRKARGRVLIVGSVGGRVALPYAGPYHASKFALEALADSLRAELAGQDVGVGLLEPGPIETPIWEKARAGVAAQRAGLKGELRRLYDQPLADFEDQLRSAERNGEAPERVAAKVADALEGPTAARYPVGRGVRTLSTLRPLLPDAVFDRIVRVIS
jgi:NAD(P)-dependent dehydrogenase (short-subunit alcohol dehydrogenase family)